MRTMLRHPNQQGYAMIVIAALLAAFMTVVGSILEENVVDDQMERQQKAAQQLSVLSKALEQYATFNGNRYPCPARPDIAYGDAAFGQTASNCYTGALNAGGLVGIRGLPDDTAGSEVVRGMVPVLALAPYGITLEDAFDPWSGRIMYVVHRQLTPGGSGSMTTGPTFTESVTSTTLSEPDFLLISYGKDHLGGVLRSQTSTMTATASCPASSTVAREENCDNDLTFIRRPVFIGSTATNATYFDDIITSYTGASELSCIATKATWNVNCSVTPTFSMPHGASISLANSAAGYVGSISINCVNGAYALSNGFCQPTGASCVWAETLNTWTGTTDCANIPNWSSQPTCESGGCTGTSPGTTTTYAAAGTACTNAMCRTSTTCTTNYGGSSNTATTTMRLCRPEAGCVAGAKTWNTNCSGSYGTAGVGNVVNVTNTAAGYAGSISGTCQGDGSISWNAGTCAASQCNLPWGGTIADGANVTAYQSAAPSGGACVSETRTCSAGSLSGSYTNQTCHAGCSITYDGSAKSVAHGFSVTRYSQSSCSAHCTWCMCEGGDCCDLYAEYAYCYDGVVYGTNPITSTNTSCSGSCSGSCGSYNCP